MRKFLVYFQQVNQTRWDVEAESPEKAVEKAEKLWRQQYGRPSLPHVVEVRK